MAHHINGSPDYGVAGWEDSVGLVYIQSFVYNDKKQTGGTHDARHIWRILETAGLNLVILKDSVSHFKSTCMVLPVNNQPKLSKFKKCSTMVDIKYA